LINQQNIARQTTNYNVEAQAYITEIQEKYRQEQKDLENQYIETNNSDNGSKSRAGTKLRNHTSAKSSRNTKSKNAN
jgi:hypothetical protein